MNTQVNTEQWVKEIPFHFQKHKISTGWLVNGDEMRCEIKTPVFQQKRFESVLKQKTGAATVPKGRFSSYLPFVAANGTFVMDVFVIPLDRTNMADIILEELQQKEKGSHPTYYCFSSTGYITGELWVPILEKFKEQMSVLAPGITPALLVDNASVHKVREVIDWCVQNHIHMFFLPAHCTHFLQPLDSTIFARLKQEIIRLLEQNITMASIWKRDLGTLMLEITQKARTVITKKVIVHAWKNVGLVPWNPQIILENVKSNVGKVLDEKSKRTALVRKMAGIVEEKIKQSAATLKRGKHRVQVQGENNGKLVSAEELKVLYEQQEEEKRQKNELRKEKKAKKREQVIEQKKREIARKKEQRVLRCRGDHPNSRTQPKWKKQTTWIWCEFCGKYGLCGDCAGTQHHRMDSHEKLCRRHHRKIIFENDQMKEPTSKKAKHSTTNIL